MGPEEVCGNMNKLWLCTSTTQLFGARLPKNSSTYRRSAPNVRGGLIVAEYYNALGINAPITPKNGAYSP